MMAHCSFLVTQISKNKHILQTTICVYVIIKNILPFKEFGIILYTIYCILCNFSICHNHTVHVLFPLDDFDYYLCYPASLLCPNSLNCLPYTDSLPSDKAVPTYIFIELKYTFSLTNQESGPSKLVCIQQCTKHNMYVLNVRSS